MMVQRKLRAALLAAGIVLAGAGGAMAAEPTHSHAHGESEATLTLDHGQKWQTDAPLRQGMGNMRAAMSKALPAIHGNKLDRAGYDALAGKLEGEMAYVVTNCKLDPQADAQLHIVLAQIGGGIEQMKAAQGENGAVAVVTALNAYGEHFDHPGWKPLGH
jgi:hypothetical protein